MKTNIVKMSLVVAMLLSTGAYAGKIIGVDAGTPYNDTTPPTQYSFGGWYLNDVDVKITDLDFNPIAKTFLPDGTYTTMVVGDSFESAISTGGEVRGLLHGKNWPVGEPSGIKIINGDTTNNGKPENCIMTTSYLDAEDNPLGGNGYLDAAFDDDPSTTPSPTLCSSAFQSHKRFKINMMPTTVDGVTPGASSTYGDPIDLVFNLVSDDNSIQRYQVLQKINNYTGLRLDGYKIEVLDGNGDPDGNLTLSIGLLENPKGTGDVDIWEVEDMANFSHGLWGPQTFEVPPHFPTDGFFDKTRAGFVVDPAGHGSNTLVGGPTTLDAVAENNYDNLFGLWLPSKWQPRGIFYDDDNDPTTDAELVAFWGTVPDAAPGTAPAWHKGKDYDNDANSWAEPTIDELIAWNTDPLYEIGGIEDTLNLGLNYIVNVGDSTQIAQSRFIVRITPRVAPLAQQTPPNYIDGDGNYIEPPTSYISNVGTIAISPEPTFAPGATLTIAVGDTDLNGDAGNPDTTEIVVTVGTADTNVVLTETDDNSSVFTGTLITDGALADGTVVTATYLDVSEDKNISAETISATTVTPLNPSSGGGGCTFNPNSKNFDMTFLLMMALGLLYPFRRRFIK